MSDSIERLIADTIKKVLVDGLEENVMTTDAFIQPKIAMYPVETKDIDGVGYVSGCEGLPMLYVELDSEDNIVNAYRSYYQYPSAPWFTIGWKKVSELVAQTIIDNSSIGGLGEIGG